LIDNRSLVLDCSFGIILAGLLIVAALALSSLLEYVQAQTSNQQQRPIENNQHQEPMQNENRRVVGQEDHVNQQHQQQQQDIDLEELGKKKN
jgi:uncharacterized protein HemX